MSPESRALLPLAESIADGSAIDWNAIETSATPDERAVLRELRVLASVAVLHRSLPAEQPLPSRSRGSTTPAIGTWGHLDLLERLGGGTFGEVYRAWDRRLEREVALKLLRTSERRAEASSSSENEQTSRIAMEGRLLAQLHHPNVITVYGVDTHDDRVGLWMELVRGATLEQILQKHGAFSAREAALVGIDLCRALAAVHGAGIIHRDVKAQNVMRESGGRIVLMDLGTGRESRPVRPHVTGDLAGTPLYLAPEIFEGAPASPRTDLYSLGVLLYRLVTGAFPARVKTMEELRAVHASGSAVRLRDARADLPTAFVQVIDRAMERDPQRRYDTAGAFEADLARALDDPSIVRLQPDSLRAMPDSPRALTGRPRPAWWRPAAVAAAIVAVVALGGIYWTAIREQPSTFTGAPAAVAPTPSIAVLPLANLTGDENQEYFADGMTDELISTLGRIGGLNVISRTSVMQFKGSTTPARQVAQALGVDAVLEGSVFVVAADGRPSTVRVNARLLRAGTDTVIWEKTFQTVVSDVLALQSQIARAVADGIQLRLTPVQERSLAAGGAQDFGAFDLYLRGRYYWNMRTKEGLTRSLQYFREAIERDPSYAVAYAGLADAYSMLGIYGFMSRAEADAQARAGVLKAIELNGELAEAHASLALLRMNRFEWASTEESFKRALQLRPAYASAHHWYAAYLAKQGRLDEALREVQRALELDPLSVSVGSEYGAILLLARRYDDAIRQLERTIRLDPGFANAHIVLAEAYAHRREYARALTAADRAAALGGDGVELRADRGYILAMAGRRSEALAIAAALAERFKNNEDGAAIGIATIQAGLGDADRTMEWLARARERNEPALADMKVDPRFDKVRSDGRFQKLLASIGLGQ